MKLLFLTALFVYFVAPGASLECFRCFLSSKICVNKATCNGSDLCFSRNFQAGPVKIFNSGCTGKEECGKEVEENLGPITYTVKTKCCSFDNCNSASAAQLSLLAISVMALAWFVGFQ